MYGVSGTPPVAERLRKQLSAWILVDSIRWKQDVSLQRCYVSEKFYGINTSIECYVPWWLCPPPQSCHIHISYHLRIWDTVFLFWVVYPRTHSPYWLVEIFSNVRSAVWQNVHYFSDLTYHTQALELWLADSVVLKTEVDCLLAW